LILMPVEDQTYQRSLGLTSTLKICPTVKKTPVEPPEPPELLFVKASTTTACAELAEMPAIPATSAHANKARLNLTIIMPRAGDGSNSGRERANSR